MQGCVASRAAWWQQYKAVVRRQQRAPRWARRVGPPRQPLPRRGRGAPWPGRRRRCRTQRLTWWRRVRTDWRAGTTQQLRRGNAPTAPPTAAPTVAPAVTRFTQRSSSSDMPRGARAAKRRAARPEATRKRTRGRMQEERSRFDARIAQKTTLTLRCSVIQLSSSHGGCRRFRRLRLHRRSRRPRDHGHQGYVPAVRDGL